MQRARITWHGPRVAEALRDAAVRGLRKAGEHLLGESRALVPIEEGTLERSGTVVVDEQALTATVAYDMPYSVRQHEDMTLRHAPGRQAKYLEQPLNSARDVMLDLIAAELRREIRQ